MSEDPVAAAQAGTVTAVSGWRDMLREHFVALDVALDGPGADRHAAFRGSVDSSLVGPLATATVTSGAQTCRRTPGLARDGDRYLQVGLLAAGSAVLEQDGRQAWLTPGAFAVYETDRPFTWRFDGPWRLQVLTWPRDVVGIDPAVGRATTARALGHDRLSALVGRSLSGAVLAGTALGSGPPPVAPGRPDDGRARAADELAALLGVSVGALPGAEPATARGALDLRRRVERYVAEHVEDPGLCPETIARAHFVSLRALHRVFADADTTVAALIRRRRVEHARRRLADPRDADRTLTELAHDCGFADLPTFSRRVRQAYGASPRSLRHR